MEECETIEKNQVQRVVTDLKRKVTHEVKKKEEEKQHKCIHKS